MKQEELFGEFEDFLVREPAPDIDYLKSREAIFYNLEYRSKPLRTKLDKRRFVLSAAIMVALAAYPVYAIAYPFLKEFKNLAGSIAVKYETETEELKSIREENFNRDIYMNEKYKDIIQGRSNALEPGAAEIIIVRSPKGFSKRFLTHPIVKDNYIEQFDLFKNKLKDESGFESLKPVFELPEGFTFSKGEFIYQRDWYTLEDEMEDIMIEAEKNGKSYAVKSINKLDKIESVSLIYKNMKDKDSTLSIRVEYRSNDTYILPEESISSIEKLIYNGDEILVYKLHNLSGSLVRKVYCILMNDLFFQLYFSKNIENDDAIEIIDAFLRM
jgi:hypothetical protein